MWGFQRLAQTPAPACLSIDLSHAFEAFDLISSKSPPFARTHTHKRKFLGLENFTY